MRNLPRAAKNIKNVRYFPHGLARRISDQNFAAHVRKRLSKLPRKAFCSQLFPHMCGGFNMEKCEQNLALFRQETGTRQSKTIRHQSASNILILTTFNNSRTNFVTRIFETNFYFIRKFLKTTEFSRACSTSVNYFQRYKTNFTPVSVITTNTQRFSLRN